jgi:hypothetical protein
MARNRKVRGQEREIATDATGIESITRKLREAAIHKAILRAFHEPKAGHDSRIWSYPLVTQTDIATRYFLDRQTLEEVLASLPRKDRPSMSGLQRWFAQVIPHVQGVMLEDAKRAEKSTELRVARGDLAASHGIYWQLLMEAASPGLEPESFSLLENKGQHFLARVAEGASNALKVQVEADRTRAQTSHEEAKTEKLRQLLDDIDGTRDGARSVTIEDVQARLRLVLGMPAHTAPTPHAAEAGAA